MSSKNGKTVPKRKKLLLPKTEKAKLKMFTVKSSSMRIKPRSTLASNVQHQVLFPPIMQVFMQLGAKTATNELCSPITNVVVGSRNTVCNSSDLIKNRRGFGNAGAVPVIFEKIPKQLDNTEFENKETDLTHCIPGSTGHLGTNLESTSCQTDLHLLDFHYDKNNIHTTSNLMEQMNVATQTSGSFYLKFPEHADSVLCKADVNILDQGRSSTSECPSASNCRNSLLMLDDLTDLNAAQLPAYWSGEMSAMSTDNHGDCQVSGKDKTNCQSQTTGMKTESHMQQTSVYTQTAGSQANSHQCLQTDASLDAEIDVLLNDIQTQTELNEVWHDPQKLTNSCTQTCFHHSDNEDDFFSQFLNMETQTDNNWFM